MAAKVISLVERLQESAKVSAEKVRREERLRQSLQKVNELIFELRKHTHEGGSVNA